MAELSVERLTLGFGGLAVLNDISLSVERGELLALIGPNGAGKTSVFNCISGIYCPGGAIRFRGLNLVGRKSHAIAAMGIGRTFQHGELFADMSVEDNVLAGRHLRMRSNAFFELLGLASVRREERRQSHLVEEILHLVGIGAYRDSDAGGLPFDVQKKVGIARALACEPAVLLLDEPSSGLSREEREELACLMMRIKEELGLAMIWIEHDMQMVADLADRIHVLDYGCSLADGTPQEVLCDPRVIGAYLGTP